MESREGESLPRNKEIKKNENENGNITERTNGKPL